MITALHFKVEATSDQAARKQAEARAKAEGHKVLQSVILRLKAGQYQIAVAIYTKER